MKRPLSERLPDDSPVLARYDASGEPAARRRWLAEHFERNTNKAHRSRFRGYVAWCREMGYQIEPQFITAEKIVEHVRYLTRVKRSALETVRQTIRALEVYAVRAGLAISTEPAYDEYYEWWDTLAEMGQAKPRRRRRKAPSAEAAASDQATTWP